MALKIAFQIFMFLASTAYQISQQNKMKRRMEAEADKRRGMRVTVRGKAESVPVVYGKQMLGGIEVKHKVSADYNYAPENSGAIVFDKGLGTENVTGTKHEFLYVQTAICHDGIEGVQFINVDSKPYNLDDENFSHRIVVNNNGGAAENLATANGIPATNTFTNTTFATAVYRLNRVEPQYSGIPFTEYFVKGRKVRQILNNSGNYSLSVAYIYSNNPALCLLDYLLNPTFGKGLSLSDIDLASFYHAAQVCNTIVMPSAKAFGHINGFKPVLDFDTVSDFPEAGEEAYIYQATNTLTLYFWDNTTGIYSIYSGSGDNRAVPLYECNITIDTSAKIRDNIEAILQTMGLAELVWSSEGKYKLLLEYPENQTELDDLIDPTHRFDEDSIIRESIDVNWIPVAERYNHVTVRFLNEHEDFKEDSKSWPPKTGSVYNQYYAEDNNQQLSTDIFFDGCSDPYHALAKAEQMVRQSRDMYTISLTVNKKGLNLEPGDFFSVSLNSQGFLNEIFRVESIEVSEDLTAKISGYKFDSGFLAWNVSDDDAYSTRPGVVSKVPGPAQITAEDTGFINTDGIFMPAVKLTWTPVNDISVKSYELQYKLVIDLTYDSYQTNQVTHTVTGLQTGAQYIFRVRAISNTGQRSSFATVTHTVGGDNINPGIPTNLAATGHFKYIALRWTNPNDIDLAFIEIYENTVNSTVGGILIGTTRGNTFTRSDLGLNETLYYYVQAVDNTGNVSGFSNIDSATTTYLDDPDFANGIYSLFKDQGLYAIRDVEGLPAFGAFEGEKVFNKNDGKLYQWTGSTWEPVVGGAETFADLTGSIAQAQIPAGIIDSARLAENSVISGKISANAVGANEIAANSIAGNKLIANTITGDKISGNTITGNNIVANTITGGLLATSGIITNSAQIGDAIIVNAKIQNAAVDTLKIAGESATVARFAGPNMGSVSQPPQFTTLASLSWTPSYSGQALVEAAAAIGVNSPNDENPGWELQLSLGDSYYGTIDSTGFQSAYTARLFCGYVVQLTAGVPINLVFRFFAWQYINSVTWSGAWIAALERYR